MSDLAALEILASINRLASEIKTISASTSDFPLWKQPWFGAIVGVFVGFSLNYFKDYFLQGAVKRKKLKCINYEVEDIKQTSSVGMQFCMDFYNQYNNDGNGRIQIQFTPEMITKCFEKFYSDVVADISHSQRDSLVKTYQHLSHYTGIRERFLKTMAETALSNGQKEKYIFIMVDCFANIFYSANCFLKNKKSNKFKMPDIIKEMGVDSHGFDSFFNKSGN